MIDFHGVHIDNRAMGFVRGTYEQIEMDLAWSLFRPYDKVIVAGAGMGWLAAWIAKRVGPRNMLAVEPQPALAQLIQENVRVNGVPLAVLNAAVTPTLCTVCITEQLGSWALRRVGGGEGTAVAGIPLSVLMLDNYDCLALDVEGDEARLLRPDILRRTEKLLVECHDFTAPGTSDIVLSNAEAAGLTLMQRDKRPDQDVTFLAMHR